MREPSDRSVSVDSVLFVLSVLPSGSVRVLPGPSSGSVADPYPVSDDVESAVEASSVESYSCDGRLTPSAFVSEFVGGGVRTRRSSPTVLDECVFE